MLPRTVVLSVMVLLLVVDLQVEGVPLAFPQWRPYKSLNSLSQGGNKCPVGWRLNMSGKCKKIWRGVVQDRSRTAVRIPGMLSVSFLCVVEERC